MTAAAADPAGSRSIALEVCTESAAGAAAAEAGGAARVELCADLARDGLTPPPALFRGARDACRLPIAAMVRPRPGDFVLRPGELERMERAAAELLDLGADLLVFGCLLPGGEVDARSLERLVAAARGHPTTFHRAFDYTPDPFRALEQLVETGVARVLTAGHGASALEGAAELARLVEVAAGRIGILAGGGVRAHNAGELARRTGVSELHSAVGAGFPGREPEAGAAAVAELVRAAQNR